MNQFLIATHSTLAEGLANAIHFFNNDAANIVSVKYNPTIKKEPTLQ